MVGMHPSQRRSEERGRGEERKRPDAVGAGDDGGPGGEGGGEGGQVAVDAVVVEGERAGGHGDGGGEVCCCWSFRDERGFRT